MRIKTASTSFLAAVLVAGASSQRILQDIPEVWGVAVPIGGDSSQFADDVDEANGSNVEAELIEALEADEQVSVVGSVELGELVCDSLLQAVNAAALSFIIQGETLLVNQESYTLTEGDVFEDGMAVHVWTGVVYSPEQSSDELVPRTVSMSWGDTCNVETFLLKVTKRNSDGTTTIIKTVPCDAVGTFICLVEVLVNFEEPGEVVILDDIIIDSGEATTSDASPAPAPTGRRLQSGSDDGTVAETQVNVMILYTDDALAKLGGINHDQMKTTILESMAWTNQAFVNSQVSLRFNPVHIGVLPYAQTASFTGRETLDEFQSNAEVAALRDTAEADLVQMIGEFNDPYCGWGYYFQGESSGFSLVRPTCLDNNVHTHEFGHNMGCLHNRDASSGLSTDYSHGLQYCTGLIPYRTIMSYRCDAFGPPRANYFSNPDVSYLDRATGTLQEDNARTLEDNMLAVSNYRGGVVAPTPTPATPPPIDISPTYTSVGCYMDDSHDRVLTGAYDKDNAAMTTEVCALLCEGSAYFGTEYGNQCFCGPTTDDPTRLGETTCDFACSGDAAQTCGGRNAISLYKYTVYSFVGCYGDDKHDRVLSGASDLDDPAMTTEVCATYCTGSTYFGTEYGKQCFCGVDTDDPDRLGDATCDFECAGDASETCGGRDALSVYTYEIIVVVDPVYLGCWGDSGDGRIMQTVHSDSSGMTNSACAIICVGYPYYGTQYGQECWCGDDSTDYQVHGTSDACTYPCPGDGGDFCGGVYAMSVWEH